jgi:hypothetical protein
LYIYQGLSKKYYTACHTIDTGGLRKSRTGILIKGKQSFVPNYIETIKNVEKLR